MATGRHLEILKSQNCICWGGM